MESITSITKERVKEDGDDQRIDNFLFKRFRNVPKNHLYQLVRSGQVRVNGKRIDANYRLRLGDMVRIPPVKIETKDSLNRTAITCLNFFSFTHLYAAPKNRFHG